MIPNTPNSQNYFNQSEPHTASQPQSTTVSSAQANPTTDTYSDKSYLSHTLLALYAGTIGMDRFYLGKKGTGIAKILTFGGLGIWVFIDFILAILDKTTDSHGRKLKRESNDTKTVLLAWLLPTAIYIGMVIIVYSLAFGIYYGSNTTNNNYQNSESVKYQ